MNVVTSTRGVGSRRASARARCRTTTVLPVPGPAGDAGRTVVVPVDEPTLLRVEEDPPRPEVALVDDALELLVGLDPREGQLAGRAS